MITKKERKQQQIKNALDSLIKNRVDFYTKTDGVHIIITADLGRRIDYWPSTGKYMVNNVVKTCSVSEIVKLSKSNTEDTKIETLLQKDVNEMTNAELKETIIILCEVLNRKNTSQAPVLKY